MDNTENNNKIIPTIIDKAEPENPDNLWVAPHLVGAIEVTNTSFFLDNDAGGYTEKASFLDYVYGLSRGELITLEKVFELMTCGIDLNVTGYEILDEKRRPFVRCTYQKDNIDYRLKIMTVDRMKQFFELYEFTILKCNVSLERLYYEALRVRPILSSNHPSPEGIISNGFQQGRLTTTAAYDKII